jgi:hypothetical protein
VSNPTQPTDKEAFDTILSVARLPMNDAEYEQLLSWYPLIRQAMLSLRIPEVRYGEPAVIYPAQPHG